MAERPGASPTGRLGLDDLEDLKPARLDAAGVEELLATQTECMLSFNDARGWPRGVVVSFVRARGSFWYTAVTSRRHVRTVAAHPRVTIVVSSAGTDLGGRRMVALRGRATVHSQGRPKDEMLRAIAARLAPADPGAMLRLLDSPNRVVVEVVPEGVSISHDSRMIAGDGRGGRRGP